MEKKPTLLGEQNITVIRSYMYWSEHALLLIVIITT